MQEKNENEENEEIEEKIVDVKGVIENFIKEEPPKLSQEEAIRQYRENDNLNTKNKKNNQDEENEDDEHLKRIKQALLESLERVNALAKKLFGEKEKEGLKDIKVDTKKGSSSGGKGKGKGIEKTEQIEPKVQDEDERSRE